MVVVIKTEEPGLRRRLDSTIASLPDDMLNGNGGWLVLRK